MVQALHYVGVVHKCISVHVVVLPVAPRSIFRRDLVASCTLV
jgi:hypothetical protein